MTGCMVIPILIFIALTVGGKMQNYWEAASAAERVVGILVGLGVSVLFAGLLLANSYYLDATSRE